MGGHGSVVSKRLHASREATGAPEWRAVQTGLQRAVLALQVFQDRLVRLRVQTLRASAVRARLLGGCLALQHR